MPLHHQHHPDATGENRSQHATLHQRKPSTRCVRPSNVNNHPPTHTPGPDVTRVTLPLAHPKKGSERSLFMASRNELIAFPPENRSESDLSLTLEPFQSLFAGELISLNCLLITGSYRRPPCWITGPLTPLYRVYLPSFYIHFGYGGRVNIYTFVKPYRYNFVGLAICEIDPSWRLIFYLLSFQEIHIILLQTVPIFTLINVKLFYYLRYN